MNIKNFIRKASGLAKWLVIPGTYGDINPDDITAIRKRKRRYVILGGLALLAVMTTVVMMLQDSSVDAPISSNLAVALTLNIILILLVVLVLLVSRLLVKLYFERRVGKAGARFQTKLVVAFLTLTLVPSALMFAVASELIEDTVDRLINTRIERTLQESLDVAERLVKDTEAQTVSHASYIAGLLKRNSVPTTGTNNTLDSLLTDKVEEYQLDLLQVYNSDFELVAQAPQAPTPENGIVDLNLHSKPDLLAKVALGEAASSLEDRGRHNYAIAVAPIPGNHRSGQVKGAVVALKAVPLDLSEKVHGIVNAFQDYKQLSLKKEVIKASYQATLALTGLVIVFSAIWFGLYLAKGITVPLKTLSEATESVARGNLDVRVDLPVKDDEVGQLIDAFNKMTLDLKTTREQVERTNRELYESNTELYHRGQYIETVLENVSGVVSIDKSGAVTTINDSAADMFGVSPDKARGKHYRKLFQPSHLDPIRKAIHDMNAKGSRKIEREISIYLNNQRVILKTSVSILTGHNGQYMGMVFVFDDVTALVAAQRAIAWREMARTITHEIKNPLTPIRLNAQRMRRKFEQKSEDFPKILDDATNVIVEEVDHLKTLVDKFSRFARQSETETPGTKNQAGDIMEPNPEPTMLHDIIFEIIKLYRNTSQEIIFSTDLDPSVHLVRIDAGQMRRVIINLVENAISAVQGAGQITIRTKADYNEGKIILEVADTGHGVSENIREEIFQPYFSTRENGTGLGLAIVSRVIADHGGRIVVRDNEGEGTVFSIELALES